MRKLAIDFGTKRCGFAVSDELSILASALENFSYENNNYLSIVERIEYWQNFYENKIDTLIIGMPTNAFDGSQNARTILVNDFISFLDKNWKNKIPIKTYDERFTTRISSQYLKDINLKNSQIKKVKDKISAVVILEDYLRSLKY